MKHALICALAASLGAATAQADPRNPKPDWVDGSSMEYPREKYLIGVGFADDRPTAEDRARAEISKIFSTVVTVNTNVTASETDETKGKKETNSFSQAVSQNVQTASKKALEDVSIVETWEDPAKRTYALAVLDRAKGMASLKDRLAQFDKETLQWKDRLDKASDKLPRVQYAMKLLALFKAREDLNGQLRILDPQGKGLPPAVDEAALRPQAAKALGELDVSVDLSGKGSERVQTGVIKGLSSLGLGAKAASAGASDIRIEGAVESEPLYDGQKKDGWMWVRSSASVSLKDAKAGKTFLQFDASERQASASAKEAARRSLEKLAEQVARKTQEGIASYFENQ